MVEDHTQFPAKLRLWQQIVGDTVLGLFVYECSLTCNSVELLKVELVSNLEPIFSN